MKIAIHGATGRMGAAIVSLIRVSQAVDEIVGASAQPGCAAIGRDLGEVHGLAPMGVLVQSDIASAMLGADVILDFSHAGAAAHLARAAAKARVALVSGTTGLGPEAIAAFDEASEKIPLLWAPNFSIGILVLVEAVRLAARKLGASFDVEVVEVHHRGKADAPSGTALRLVGAAQEARNALSPIFGRQGVIGPRTNDELGVLALRGGDVVGDHTVHFLGPGERLELTHRATSRECLARGAMVAARRIHGRNPGRYSLEDLVGS